MMFLYMGGKLVSVGKKGIIFDACAEAIFLLNYSIWIEIFIGNEKYYIAIT